MFKSGYGNIFGDQLSVCIRVIAYRFIHLKEINTKLNFNNNSIS